MKFKQFAVLLAVITFSTWIITFNLSPSKGSVKAGNYGFINKKGLLVIKPQYSEVLNFSQGLAAVKLDDKWGYLDKTGKVVVKPQFSEAYSFSEGLAAVRVDDKWGYIDKTARIVVKPQFYDVYSFSEGLAIVNRLGYIDKVGKQSIQIEVEDSAYSDGDIIDVQNFSQGLAAVQIGGGGTCGPVLCVYGYIDKTGKMIVEPEFLKLGNFLRDWQPYRPMIAQVEQT